MCCYNCSKQKQPANQTAEKPFWCNKLISARRTKAHPNSAILTEKIWKGNDRFSREAPPRNNSSAILAGEEPAVLLARLTQQTDLLLNCAQKSKQPTIAFLHPRDLQSQLCCVRRSKDSLLLHKSGFPCSNAAANSNGTGQTSP